MGICCNISNGGMVFIILFFFRIVIYYVLVKSKKKIVFFFIWIDKLGYCVICIWLIKKIVFLKRKKMKNIIWKKVDYYLILCIFIILIVFLIFV